MSSGMNVEEAKIVAQNMTYRQALMNCLGAKCVPYRKATKIKVNELLDMIPFEEEYVVKKELWIDTKCKCGKIFSKHHGDGYYSIPYENMTNYCPNCGVKLNWS